jgi:hypothetical protein
MSIRDYYQALSSFCSTDRQREILNAYTDCGHSSNKAGKQLDISGRSVRLCLERVRRRAAEAGFTEGFDATRYVDPGQMVHGKSTLTKDADGNTVWIKTSRRKAAESLALTATDNITELIPWQTVKTPAVSLKDQVTCYVLTDYHIGAYSWHKETGADWDLDIAEKVLQNAVQDLINGSPDSEQAIFCQLGDFLHWDGLQAVTPTAKNILDGDGRFEKLTDIALEACLNVVNLLLGKHKKVHVIMAEGNHDPAGSVWLRLIMKKLFSKNKRVTVEDSPFPYYKFCWGNTFLGFHHGHLSRIKQMPGKFYSEFASEMGQSEYRYLHTGHLHLKEVLEDSGVVVERHPTLNARDAYGARGFSKTIRAAQAITYGKIGGEISRNVVYPRDK